MDGKSCPLCGNGVLKRETKPILVEHSGRSFTVQQPGEYCSSCDDGIITGVDMKQTEDEIREFRAKIDRPLS